MAHFARKVRYGAHDGDSGASYMALIQLSHHKSGSHDSRFVLYRRIIQYNYPSESRTEMIELQAETVEKAISRFWPWSDSGGEEFPGYRSELWTKTTLWLDAVAAGGCYERFGYRSELGQTRFGDWVKVGTPAPWARRRKKRPLQIGNPAHIILARRATIAGLEEQKMHLEWLQNDLESYDDENDCNYVAEENAGAHTDLQVQIDRIESEVIVLEQEIVAYTAELRVQVRKKFPNPIGKIPKRELRKRVEQILAYP